MAQINASFSGSVTLTPDELATFRAAIWYVGDGVPPDSLGNDGDLYLDKSTGDIYLKENETWA